MAPLAAGHTPGPPRRHAVGLWDLGDSVGLDDATVRGTAPGAPSRSRPRDRRRRVDGRAGDPAGPGWLAPLAIIANGRRHAVADLPVPDGQTTAWPLVTTLATDGLVSLGLGA